MGTEDIKIKINKLIEPVINSCGIDLDHLEFGRMGRRGLLRVFIEKEGGVTLDDCELISREIAAVLDVEDPVPYPYVLEVSSPGLDRLLKGPKDFKKYSGKTARIITTEPIEKQTFFIGQIADAGDDEVSLLLPKDKKIIIPYENISKARLEVEI
ncbi:MAG: ribosome maturation factor RimP [Nitrospiraceae bacterium]|nr:MAG: ribosome maturation factor RimP [Nitrospiraceae bacterium]